MKKVYLISLQIMGLVLFITLYACNNTSTNSDSYHERIMSVEEIECSKPTDFLTVDATYNENFLGNKIKIHGVIKNQATVASYKDAVVQVSYYSKTHTELGSKEYTIYESFPPHSEVKFELKVDNYANVSTVKVNIIQAIAN